MTIIFQKGEEFWIESHVVARLSIVQGVTLTTVTLDRPGAFLGVSGARDDILTEANSDDIGWAVINTDNTELVIGDVITALRLRRTNSLAGAQIFGVKLIVFLRGIG